MKPYPKYKSSGVPWLGDVPEHWEVKRIRFMARLNPRATRKLDPAERVSFLPMEAVGDDGSLKLEQTRPVEEVSTGYTYFEDGDVTVAKITPCFENGKGANMQGLTGGVGFGTTELIVLRPSEAIHPQWLYLLTQTTLFRKRGEALMQGSGGQKRVPDGYIKDLSVAWPCEVEQEAIAAYLDVEAARIDILVSEKEKLIELLREYRQSVITEAVTKGLDPDVPTKDSGVPWLGDVPEHWDVKAVKRLSSVCRGASPRPIDDPIYFDDDGEYIWVRISDVTASDGVLTESTQRLSQLGASLSVPLEPGELFLSIAGSVGKPCITGVKACIHDGFVYFPALEAESRKFLYYVFLAGEAYKGLGKMGTQLNLNTDTVGAIKIGVPAPNEQSAIAAYLDVQTIKIDGLIAHVEKEIELLKELRSATITDAVLGRIDLRDYTKKNKQDMASELQPAL